MPDDADDFAAGFNSTAPESDQQSTPQVDAKQDDKPASNETPADAGSEAEAKGSGEGKADADDPASELQRQLAEAQHRERSSANRVSHFMRENNQLKEKLAEFDKKLKELSAAKAAPTPDAEDEAEPNDVLAGAPDLRAAVEKRVERRTAKLAAELAELKDKLSKVDEAASKAAAELQPLRERDERAEAERVLAELDKSLVGWRDDVKSPQFKEWLSAQPRAVQHLYENGRTVAEASTVIKLYRTDTGATGKPASESKPTEDAAAKAARLKDAAGIRPKPATPKVDDRDSFSAGFRMQTT